MASDRNALELNAMNNAASSNRFQVNPVNNNGSASTATNANGNENPIHLEDDTFDENGVEIGRRRSSRLLSIKSSFRDKEKPVRLKETTTRFKVEGESDSNDDEDTLLDNSDYDTKYGRSFR